MNNSKNIVLSIAAAIGAISSQPAMAGSTDGKIQVKILASGVLADGKIDSVPFDGIGLPAGSQTVLSDNVVPTLAAEFFLSPNLSVETICCFTQHHLNGAGALEGARIVDHILVLPATVTAKFHLAADGPVRPYVGAGPAMYFYIDERPGATSASLGADRVKLENKPGLALQAGLDFPLGDNGYAFSIDAKRYFVKTTAHFYAVDEAEVLTTKHTVSPWVISAGVAYRF